MKYIIAITSLIRVQTCTQLQLAAVQTFLKHKFSVRMEACTCSTYAGNGLDMETPRNEKLTAFYKRSFAHHTVKERMPLIITQTIDGLVRNKGDIGETYGTEALEELKTVIGELSKLKYEVQTNKAIREVRSPREDAKVYNLHLKEQIDRSGICTYFNTIWLHAECYMYRRIREIFENTNSLTDFDPFRKQKEASFFNALSGITALGEHLLQIFNKDSEENICKEDFNLLLKCSLWSNKCDLSLSNGEITKPDAFLDVITELNANILCDHSEGIWEAANTENRFQTIDIVFDNAGYEVFSDLCLADYLITKKLALKVRFYVKTIPWFISDVMKEDFNWLLEQLKANENESLKTLSSRWSDYIKNQTWSIEEHDFWTLPLEYKDMFTIDENLFRKLARAKLVIFKGDLNYRKLFGERNWDPTTPVEQALEGFHPTRLCSLRTLKADMVCGLEEGVDEKTAAKDKNWLVSGNFGVMQYCGKIKRLL